MCAWVDGVGLERYSSPLTDIIPRLSGVVIPSGEEEEEEEGVRQKTMTERVNLALVYVYTAKSCTLVPFVTN